MTHFKAHGRIAVIDVETTGLFPARNDRIVEVAAVVIEADGRIVKEFVSLVNPCRDIGPTSIHGLSSEDIIEAPTFSDIAWQIIETVGDTIAIAGHNIRFDRQFLVSEFSRIPAKIPDVFEICTMQLAGGGKLKQCCSDYGIENSEDEHNALADARAAAKLLAQLLPDQPGLTKQLMNLSPNRWPDIPFGTKRPITRVHSRERQREVPTFLQRLLARRGATDCEQASGGAVMAYMALLDRVLEDRQIDQAEGDALFEMAGRWGLNGTQIGIAHKAYLDQLAITALADGVFSDTERKDLNLVARLLGQNSIEGVLDEAVQRMADIRSPQAAKPDAASNLVGKRVCFTGELRCLYNSEPMTRETAEALAEQAGLIIADSVTKSLEILVVADPHTQSGKAKKARRYGIRILHEAVFWKSIGIEVT